MEKIERGFVPEELQGRNWLWDYQVPDLHPNVLLSYPVYINGILKIITKPAWVVQNFYKLHGRGQNSWFAIKD